MSARLRVLVVDDEAAILRFLRPALEANGYDMSSTATVADAVKQIAGSIARSPFVAGEPIREQKLVKAEGSGYMAAILPECMRAVSTEISAESGAGAGTDATFGRIYASDGSTCHCQFTAGETADDAEMTLDNKNIADAQTVTVNSFSFNGNN